MEANWWGNVTGIQSTRAMVRASIGVARKSHEAADDGFIGSFINSFTPSAIGWRSPYGPTSVGPFRACIYPSALRSPRVMKATERRTGTIMRSVWIRKIIIEMRFIY